MNKLDFGGSKNQKKPKKWNEICQMLVSGALDDTKKMRKAGADIFAKSGLEKPKNKLNKSRFSPGFFPFFPWTEPRTREFPYKRLGAIWIYS